MSENPFAALLDGVPRYGVNVVSAKMERHPYGVYVELDRVLAALAAAVPADLAEAGKVLEGVTPGRVVQFHPSFCKEAEGAPFSEWDSSHDLSVIQPDGKRYRIGSMRHANDAAFFQWCREGVPALLARVAAQEAQIKGLEAERNRYKMACDSQGKVVVDVAGTMDKISPAQMEAMSVILLNPMILASEARAEAAETALAAMTKERDLLQGTADEAKRLWAESETALAAERAKVAKLVEALTRQCDNMAFVLNHAEIPNHYYDKLTQELEADRAAITEANHGT